MFTLKTLLDRNKVFSFFHLYPYHLTTEQYTHLDSICVKP